MIPVASHRSDLACQYLIIFTLVTEGLFVCLSVRRITKEVMDGFGRNFADRLVVCDKDELFRVW